MRRLFKQFFRPQPVLVEIGVPEPITELKRTHANVKVMWTPSTSKNVVSQHIKITGTTTNKVYIEKDIDTNDYAFSFAANKGAALTITITAFNGEKDSEPVTLDIIV